MGLTREQDQQIETLYRNISDKLYIYARNALDNPAQAEEAVQETFRIACTKPDEFLGCGNPPGWLVNTLKNVIKNTRRSQARLNLLVVKAISLQGDLTISTGTAENIDLLYSDLIANEDFELIRRIVIDRYSMLEAAKELGISVEACKKRVQRAKQKLRKILEDMDNEQ